MGASQFVRRGVFCLLLVLTAWSSSAVLADDSAPLPVRRLVLVVGAAGEEQYEAEFAIWADQWRSLAERQQWELIDVPTPPSEEDEEQTSDEVSAKSQLKTAIQQELHPEQQLWIVMLGHGTFSGGGAKFNLRGPDVSAKEMQEWLKPVESQIVLINCSAASAPFLTELSGDNRVLVTATKSGSEYNFTWFGKYLANALDDFSNDLDHDREVSLLEAFLAAANNTKRYYDQDARLLSEHALLNDNGDKVGTGADFYRGVRPAKEAKDGNLDGSRAARLILLTSPDNPVFPPELDAQRAAIEAELDQLRAQKGLLPEDAYFGQLEELLLRLSSVYDQAEAQQPAKDVIDPASANAPDSVNDATSDNDPNSESGI